VFPDPDSPALDPDPGFAESGYKSSFYNKKNCEKFTGGEKNDAVILTPMYDFQA
jgi:hypothetical protein